MPGITRRSTKAEAPDRGRFSANRKAEAVLRLLRGEDLDALSRELGVTAATPSGWRESFLDGGKAALKSWPTDDWDEEIAQLQAEVGQLTMVNELLGTRCQHPEAVRRGGGAPEPLGLLSHRQVVRPQRACRIFGLPRSTAYEPRPETPYLSSSGPCPGSGARSGWASTRSSSATSGGCWPRARSPASGIARSGRGFATGASAHPLSG